jgi:hypothetical protein
VIELVSGIFPCFEILEMSKRPNEMRESSAGAARESLRKRFACPMRFPILGAEKSAEMKCGPTRWSFNRFSLSECYR